MMTATIPMASTTVSLAVPTQMLYDQFVTAMEGGSTYWAQIHEYHWGTLDNPATRDFYADILDVETGKIHRLDLDAMTMGLRRLAQDQFTYAGRKAADGFRGRLLGDILSENGDANTADLLVQIGLFGDVVYG